MHMLSTTHNCHLEKYVNGVPGTIVVLLRPGGERRTIKKGEGTAHVQLPIYDRIHVPDVHRFQDLETAFVTAAGEDRSVADHHVACQGDVVTPVKVAKRAPLLEMHGDPAAYRC